MENKPKSPAQGLAISYDAMKRNKRRKMANGGPVSASNERRPMPAQVSNDAGSVSRNSGNKAPSQDQMLDSPTVRQAQKPSITPLSRPKFVNGSFKVRDRADVEQEERMMSSMPPDGYGKQPAKELDEMGADRKGPMTPALKMKMMAEGGDVKKIDTTFGSDATYNGYTFDPDKAEDRQAYHNEINRHRSPEHRTSTPVPRYDNLVEKEPKSGYYAKGGMINDVVSLHSAEEDEVQHPAGLESDDDMMAPKESEIMADHFAEGGMAMEMDDQPEPEAEEEHHASIADAIMAKRRKMANGGQVDIDENAEEQPNGYYAQNEDAVLKENYDSDMDDVSQPMDSNEHSISIESNKRDRVDAIRARMKRMRG